MTKPENIRQTINANRQELEELGVITHTVITPGAKGGPPGRAFYLNEEQATYVTMHAKTPKAREVKLLVVRVFTAWRKGEVPPQRGETGPNGECAYWSAELSRLVRLFPSTYSGHGVRGVRV